MTSETLHSDQAAAPTPEPLLQMIQGLAVTAILQAGVQLRVFDHVADGKIQSTAIAAAIDADERGTRILLDALAALRLLERDDGRTTSRRWQTPSWSPVDRRTWADCSTFLLRTRAWTSHQRLAEVVRQWRNPSRTARRNTGTYLLGSLRTLECGACGTRRARPSPSLSGNGVLQRESLEILDVACGSGLLSLTFAAEHPTARATLLDWANSSSAPRTTSTGWACTSAPVSSKVTCSPVPFARALRPDYR